MTRLAPDVPARAMAHSPVVVRRALSAGETWVFAALVILLATTIHLTSSESDSTIILQGVALVGAFMAAAMVCHGELAQLKPAPSRLTSFYLAIAIGGSLGAAFVTLVAPLLFNWYAELPLLFLLVLLGGMIPVVGGVMSGVVLCLVAYDAKGFVGVGVFLGVTFVLSKVESYYLSPRLTAQHVKLPGLALVISLLMFETIFGFYGLFLSFPALYVASRIANEWKEEDRVIMDAGGTLSNPSPPPTDRA